MDGLSGGQCYPKLHYIRDQVLFYVNAPIYLIILLENQVFIPDFPVGKLSNLTATILPMKNKYMSYAIHFFHQKLYFSPYELKTVKKYGCKPAIGQRHTLFNWGDIFFATYCCYELTSISLRHTFQGTADIIFGVEWNKDTYYFGNIIEALSRDIYCYCVQSNISEYGDSRIIQPTKKDLMNILKVKGGINASVLIGKIDIQELRVNQKNKNDISDKSVYKPLPAGWDLTKTNMKK